MDASHFGDPNYGPEHVDDTPELLDEWLKTDHSMSYVEWLLSKQPKITTDKGQIKQAILDSVQRSDDLLAAEAQWRTDTKVDLTNRINETQRSKSARTVPVVTYENGSRREIGRAFVDIEVKDGDVYTKVTIEAGSMSLKQMLSLPQTGFFSIG
jgi:hypothetical protein